MHVLLACREYKAQVHVKEIRIIKKGGGKRKAGCLCSLRPGLCACFGRKRLARTAARWGMKIEITV